MKFTLATFLSGLAATTAFAPVTPTVTSSTTLGAASFFQKKATPAAKSNGLPQWWNDQVGVTEPAGFFDPLKLSEGQDAQTLVKFREAEVREESHSKGGTGRRATTRR